MIKKILIAILFVPSIFAVASPEKDYDEFVSYFENRFPDTPFEDYKNGVYSIDKSAREQWEAMEEFPPYELNVDRGEELFNRPFKNGNTYGSCFENEGIGIRQNYPYFDTDKNKVVTLEGAINDCRVKNGEKPLSYFKGKNLLMFLLTWLTHREATNLMLRYQTQKRHLMPTRMVNVYILQKKVNLTSHVLIAMSIRQVQN